MKVVTIDGPAGSGKSSVARRVAQQLGWTYITTGAIYRTFGLLVFETNANFKNEAEALQLAQKLGELYQQDTSTGRVFLGNREVTSDIRTPRISEMASFVAENAVVRRLLLPLQRRIVESAQGAVVDGRDMGTVVFPEALLKVFLTASPEERARRRAAELKAQGKEANLEELVKEIHERDARDAGRACAPMVQASDAILIDSTQLNMDDVINKILLLCESKGQLHSSKT